MNSRTGQWKEQVVRQAQLDKWREQVVPRAERGQLLQVDVAMLSKLIAQHSPKTEEWLEIVNMAKSRPLFRVRAMANSFLCKEHVPVAVHELQTADQWVISYE